MSCAFLVLLYYTLQTLHRERFADVVLIVNTLSSNCCLSMTCWGLHHCKWSTASVFALVQGGLTCYLCKIISSPTGDSVSSSILFRFMPPHSTQDKPDKANVLMSRSRHHNRLKISFIFFFMTDHFYSNMEHQKICLIVKLYGKSSLESWPVPSTSYSTCPSSEGRPSYGAIFDPAFFFLKMGQTRNNFEE